MTAPRVERCELSDLPIDQCGCKKHRPDGGQVYVRPTVPRTGTYGPTEVTAKYSGTCPECRERYEFGEPIRPQRANGTGTGRWAHSECAEEAS